MSQPVVYFRTRETVKRIVEVLKMTEHNGFPVIEGNENEVNYLLQKKKKLVLLFYVNLFYLSSYR